MARRPHVDPGRGRRKRLVVAGLALASLASPADAAAHAGPPRATAVAVAPDDAATLLVTTTYGLVLSRDAGASWSWLCGEGVGYDSELELPAVALFAGGGLAVAAFEGLRLSVGGCGWSAAPGEVGDSYFLRMVSSDGGHGATALTSNALGGYLFDVGLWSTADDGASWARMGSSPPADFVAFDVASPGGERVYLAGRDGDAGSLTEVVLRSDDGGESWVRAPLPGSRADVKTRLVAHPSDPDQLAVYSGDVGESYRVLLSRDGGETFEALVEGAEEVSAVVFSPDGSHLAVGSTAEGLTVIELADGSTTTTALAVGCLTWAESGLHACADEASDGFAVGLSTDFGASFEGVMSVSSPCGALTCEDDSLALCELAWATESVELGAASCSLDEPSVEEEADEVGGSQSPSCALGSPRDSRRERGAWWLIAAMALPLGRRRQRA